MRGGSACSGEPDELLVLERRLAALDQAVEPRTRQAAREMAPVRGNQRAGEIVRAWRGDIGAEFVDEMLAAIDEAASN